MIPHLASSIVGDVACTEDQAVNSLFLTWAAVVPPVLPSQRRLEAMEAEYGGVLGCVLDLLRTSVAFMKECVRKCASCFFR